MFLNTLLFFFLHTGRKNCCPGMTWNCLGDLCTISMRVSCTQKLSISVLTGSQSRPLALFIFLPISAVISLILVCCELWKQVQTKSSMWLDTMFYNRMEPDGHARTHSAPLTLNCHHSQSFTHCFKALVNLVMLSATVYAIYLLYIYN